ncbi:PREDICTED: putative F-box protein PP2-B12 [Nelumbo nucifera]|uniref:F-box protein PP2-B12 n=1 Tax=Nelumbo nucifera TaxID=4432 RepID=A0A1U7YTR5_NELNU|nr:PREDICTED: putative F-box protein PP2-B12 [Nelumbo nucifera]
MADNQNSEDEARERENRMEEGSSSTTVGFYALPEGCISNIISLTSPQDACRSLVVSSEFRSAADSDAVWERFLPSDYRDILSRSASAVDFPSKKDLYFHLCDHPILIDDGQKSFALERRSGKKCFMIATNELSIVWGSTPQYWAWRFHPESRFSEVAELLEVCWLEVHGKIETRMLSPRTIYGAYLVFKLAENRRGLDILPAELSVRFAGTEGGDVRSVYLDPQSPRQPYHRNRMTFSQLLRRRFSLLRPPMLEGRQEAQYPQERQDGWLEIEMGEFFNDRGEDGEVEMNLMEVKGGHWKCGLIIQGIEIRPKQIK